MMKTKKPAIEEMLFPKKWSGSLSSSQVKNLLYLDHKLTNHITQSSLGEKKWDHYQRQTLLEEKRRSLNENWQLITDDKTLLIWKNDKPLSSEPDALISFGIDVLRKTKGGKPTAICLTNNLMWVQPESRGQGLGYHLVAHFISYLMSCTIKYPLISKNGIDLTYYADFDSKGGESLSNYIFNFLNICITIKHLGS